MIERWLGHPVPGQTRWETIRLRRRYRAAAYPVVQPWDWSATRYNRIALVSHLLAGITDPAYLEIGCDRNVLFDALPIIDKTGVDPSRGGTVRMTSDAFFAHNRRRFDVVFVDGLHHYDQAHRDAANALNVLKPGGWLLLHDMLPTTWREEHVPRIDAQWTGDVWKVGYELSRSDGIDVMIAAIDHGVGIARRRLPDASLADLSAQIADWRYRDYCGIVPTLPIRDWATVMAWIDDV